MRGTNKMKRYYIKTATELGYSSEIIRKIEKASGENEMIRIMKDARDSKTFQELDNR